MRWIKQLIYSLLISIFILDSQTVITGMKEGLELCMQSAIPALFPFLVITPMLNSVLPNFILRWIKPIGKLCGIPNGGESIFLLGFLSGYPNGARLIAQGWENKQINRQDAWRMMGFCNNVGPTFLFGICGAMLPTRAVWTLFVIQIASAIITGILLPNKSRDNMKQHRTDPITITAAIKSAITVMSTICAWILLFSVMLTFMEKYTSGILNDTAQKTIYAALEITNGILAIDPQHIMGYKFIFISVIITWGGLCVAAQTISVTKKLGIGYYFPGKCLQTGISFLLSSATQYAIFDASSCYTPPVYLIIGVVIFMGVTTAYMHRKKTVAISPKIMYNAVATKK